MPHWISIARWVHILSSAAWLGEICITVFVMIPRLALIPRSERSVFFSTIFSPISRIASWFVITSLVSGLWLNYLMTHWIDISSYLLTRHGQLVGIAGVLGLVIASAHFFLAPRIEAVFARDDSTPATEARLLFYLKIIPRVGLACITSTFILMAIAAHGF